MWHVGSRLGTSLDLVLGTGAGALRDRIPVTLEEPGQPSFPSASGLC